MTEQDVRAGLHEAVAAEPPLDFDPDALVADARRLVRRRRALVSASLATALVAVTAVSLPAVLGAGQGSGITPADRPSATSEPPAPKRTPGPTTSAPAGESVEELELRADEMLRHLERTLPGVMPEARKIMVLPFGGEASGEIVEGQRYLNAFVTFMLKNNHYGISVNVFAPGHYQQSQDEVCSTMPNGCREVISRGQKVVFVESSGDASGNDSGIRTVTGYHYRQDGSVVTVDSYNYDPTATAPRPRTTLVLPDDQIADIATDPMLHVP